jgi:hypothetical protein
MGRVEISTSSMGIVTADRQGQAVDAGEVVVATVVADGFHRHEGVA